MAISGWHPRYSIGIKVIDDQHQEIFLALSRLRNAVNMGGEGESVHELLEYFDLLTKRHFKTEEDFMRLHGYPDYEAHAEEHRQARLNLEDIQQRYRENDQALVSMVTTFVNGWMKHHISEGDFKYAAFLKEKGIQ
ncbi:MAG: bacteriohemerythrin [Firmicutes bacterium]|nr:bacteriohemerythrin [Bacillota bacterium]